MKSQTLERQFKLWTILLIVVPSLLIMAIYTVDQVRIAKQQILEQISQRVELQQRLVDNWMEERAVNVRELAEAETYNTLDKQQIIRDLHSKSYHDGTFDSLSYINKDGLFQASTFGTGISYLSVAGQPYFEAAREGKNFVSDVVMGRNSGQAIINFSSPVYDRERNFQGLILGSVRITKLESLIRENWTGQTGETALVNREGTILTKPRRIDELADKDIPENVAMLRFKLTNDAFRNIRLGESGTASWTDYRGIPVLGAYKYVPERGWTIIGKIDEAEVLTPIYRQLATMAGGTFLLLMLILPWATLITNRFKQPIEWLIEQSNLVATENYAVVGRDKRPDHISQEMASLCNTFVNMSRKIENTIGQLKEKETILECVVLEKEYVNSSLKKEIGEHQAADEALRQLNDALEHKVQERTMALSEEIRQQKLAEERFYKAFHINPGMMAIIEMPAWRFIDTNESYARAVGRSREEVVGRTVDEIKLWADDKEKENIRNQFIEEGQVRNAEMHFLTKDGKRRRGLLSADMITLGDVKCCLGIITDVTEQKRFDDEIARLDKMNLVGQMAASIGHEIRNPLTTVRGYLQLFQRKDKLAEYGEQLHTMIEELDRANAIITEFLSLAKNKAVEMEQGNLNDIINALFPLLQADAFRTGHDIKIVAGSIPDCNFDKKEIRQLLLNLVRNALDASPQGGIVTICTYRTTAQAILVVQDRGSGIPKDILAKLGTPFVSGKEGGTGLGLAVCYRIAQRHSARLEVKTSAKGTTFMVKFPSGDVDFGYGADIAKT